MAEITVPSEMDQNSSMPCPIWSVPQQALRPALASVRIELSCFRLFRVDPRLIQTEQALQRC